MLGFIVLLSIVVLTFLSSSLLDRQISTAHTNLANAQGIGTVAINNTIGDLQQEIAAGSLSSNIPPSATGLITNITIYRPASPAAAVPYTVGVTRSINGGVEMDGLANLYKVSTPSPFYPSGTPYANAVVTAPVPNRATTVKSTTSSLNGRLVSLASWNKHLLVAQNAGNLDAASTTPIGGFPAPTWIEVSRDGSNPTTWSTALADKTQNQFILGRYAYAIYNEGGLLDVNVAGSPVSSSATPSTWAATKTALAYADLTQIPGLGGTGTLVPLSASQQATIINAIVGWRNAASAPPGGSFPSYSYGALPTQMSAMSSFDQYLFQQTGGFLMPGNSTLSAGGDSDHLFPGRQALIDYLTALTTAPGSTIPLADIQQAMQYLGTFSRDLNQPSFWPDPNRPRISPTSAVSYTAYKGNNDSGGKDDQINPSFLSVRVPTTVNIFTRFDGSPSVPGEPLVKHRFPLSRLAWLTYKGPAATNFSSTTTGYQTAVENGGISQATIAQGTAANVYACFGLTWNTGYWTYNHHGNTGPGTPEPIETLSQVALDGREPDFIELLKAAICAGSLGKGAAGNVNAPLNQTYDPGKLQHSLDTVLDYQVIQIAADIIDQFDADGYPTHIQFNNGTATGVQDFYGIENLPYLMTMAVMPVQIKASVPSVVAATGTGPTAQVPVSGTQYPVQVPAGTLTDTGDAVMLACPVIWNPHDESSSPGTPAPSSFKFTAESQDPTTGTKDAFTFSYRAWDIPAQGTTPTWAGKSSDGGVAYSTTASNSTQTVVSQAPAPQPLNETNTELDFSAPNSTLYRRPTVLKQVGLPSGSQLAMGLGHYLHSSHVYGSDLAFGGANGALNSTDTSSPQAAYIGCYLDGFPLRWTISTIALPPVTTLYTAGGAQPVPQSGTYSYGNIVSHLYYNDANGNPVLYDTADMGMSLESGFTYGLGHPDNWAYNLLSASVRVDPRTNRFGTLSSSGFQNIAGTTGGVSNKLAVNGTIATQRPDAGLDNWTLLRNTPGSIYGASLTTALLKGMGWPIPHPAPGVYGSTYLDAGTLTQNNPLVTYAFANGSQPEYYVDADGVVRRAVGAYATGNTTGNPTIGLPMATAYTSTGSPSPATQGQSRPIVLNRPFQSVADLGYVFRGEPYKNLDFSTPQSGDTALLDVFCVNDDTRTDALVAGKVDLNTRQAPVLQAILNGAYKDELTQQNLAPAGDTIAALTSSEAQLIANALVKRTTDTTDVNEGPLLNVAELVGRYVNGWADPYTPFYYNSTTPITGDYDGFSNDLGNGTYADSSSPLIPRLRETAMRALAESGTARTWNLLIDVVAQTGRYPFSATGFDQFIVEGQQHYWVHVAIDRYTDQVIDERIEPVKE